jgi:hypothetical protein
VFPLVGVVFLARLVAAVCAVFRGVTDAELAAAVTYAWKQKNRKSITQQSEGLFLFTVPEAIAALRRKPAPPPGPDLAEGLARLLERVERALRARGAPIFDELARRAVKLREEAPIRELGQLYDDVSALEMSIETAAPGALNQEERDTVTACVAAALLDWDNWSAGKLPREKCVAERERVQEITTRRETLKVLMIPSLSGGYA